jgi:hypothetical protein
LKKDVFILGEESKKNPEITINLKCSEAEQIYPYQIAVRLRAYA